MMEKLVVIGAGMASGRMLEALSDAGAPFDITLFNAEPRGNYNRIMLSPVLSGEKTYAEIVTHDEDWYSARGITTRFGEHVVGIDRARKVVIGQQGEVPYDKLVIATGSAPFMIPVAGRDLPGVIAYRDLDDTNTMIAAARPGAEAVVIGGGLLGLEAAAGLHQGCRDAAAPHRPLPAENGRPAERAPVAFAGVGRVHALLQVGRQGRTLGHGLQDRHRPGGAVLPLQPLELAPQRQKPGTLIDGQKGKQSPRRRILGCRHRLSIMAQMDRMIAAMDFRQVMQQQHGNHARQIHALSRAHHQRPKRQMP